MILSRVSPSTGKTLRSKLKVTVVIPCLNDGETLAPILKELKNVTDEIIVVDDGSSDNTALVVKSSKNILINHNKTKGYDKSLNDGFKLAASRGAGIILTYDADGEHKISDVDRVLAPLRMGKADVVIGARTEKRHLLQNVFGILARKMYGISDPLSGLKAYKSKVYKSVGFFDNVGSIGTQLSVRAVKNGFVLLEVPIETKRRKDKSRFYANNVLSNLKVLRSMFFMITQRL